MVVERSCGASISPRPPYQPCNRKEYRPSLGGQQSACSCVRLHPSSFQLHPHSDASRASLCVDSSLVARTSRALPPERSTTAEASPVPLSPLTTMSTDSSTRGSTSSRAALAGSPERFALVA